MVNRSTKTFANNESAILRLSYLISNEIIKQGHHLKFHFEWKNGINISIESNLKDNECWIRLEYVFGNNKTQEKYNFDYKIFLSKQLSNLGRGIIFYFICPDSGLKARTLYLCHDSHTWKHRKAFKKRIYYSCQKLSKEKRWQEKHWRYDTIVKQLESSRRKQLTYKGEETRHSLRMQKLKTKRREADNDMWMYFYKKLGLDKVDSSET